MQEKFKTLHNLALQLKGEGFARQAERVSNLIFKKALEIDVNFLNQVRERLGDLILEMEYYPPGAGLFPEKQEIGIFLKDLKEEGRIRTELKSLGFDFQALVTDSFFSGTISGASSQAVKKLQPGYYALIVTMEKNTKKANPSLPR